VPKALVQIVHRRIVFAQNAHVKMHDPHEPVDKRYIIGIVALLVLFYLQLIAGWVSRIDWLQTL
jgi:hypothetical protein